MLYIPNLIMKDHSSLSQVEVEAQALSGCSWRFRHSCNASASMKVSNPNILEIGISSETRSHDTQALIFRIVWII